MLHIPFLYVYLGVSGAEPEHVCTQEDIAWFEVGSGRVFAGLQELFGA